MSDLQTIFNEVSFTKMGSTTMGVKTVHNGNVIKTFRIKEGRGEPTKLKNNMLKWVRENGYTKVSGSARR